MAKKLPTQLVEKPWGRDRIPAMFGPTNDRPIGEVWFAESELLPLLVKYIFTSEPLSIQVHPDDRQAGERGLPQGKSECWYILEAESGAKLGLGLKRRASKEELRSAALDGSIGALVNWRPVRAGDFFIVPSGTVHAIGAGISILEFQQNTDVTYRLYDYGRPRELHLDDGIAVSLPETYPAQLAQHVELGETQVLVDGPHFWLMQLVGDETGADRLTDRQRWVMPLDGHAQSGAIQAGPGECLLLEAGDPLLCRGARVLVGGSGGLGST